MRKFILLVVQNEKRRKLQFSLQKHWSIDVVQKKERNFLVKLNNDFPKQALTVAIIQVDCIRNKLIVQLH